MNERDTDRSGMQPREVEARKRLINLLELNNEQQLDFEQASLKFQQDVRRTLQESNLETRDKIRQYNEQLDQEMRNILNDDQYTKWQKFHQRRMQMLQNRNDQWRRERRFND
jgi:hypothetical protein